MKLHRLEQGSPEWHAHRNGGDFFNASDAPMMMGCSSYGTRADLLHRLATGLKPDVDAATERRFNDGHRFERLARPFAAAIIGDDLFPVVGSEEFEILLPFGRSLSASFDGLTMELEDVLEHKSLNDAIRAALPHAGLELAQGEKNDARALSLDYRVQMEQQLAVCKGRRALFMASKFGPQDALIEVRWCWYYPDMELREQILRGWAQLATDLADYKPGAVIVPATALVSTAAVETLPVPVAALQGEVKIRDNLDVTSEQLRAFIARIPKKPTTDEEFAFAKGAVKKLDEFEKLLKAEETRTLAGLAPVQVFRQTVATQLELASRTRLDTDKLVTRRETEIKTEQISRGKSALTAHIAQLNDRLGKPYMPTIPADFAGAISGKRTHSSLLAAIDQCLATAKIEASRVADGIEANLKWLRENAKGYESLFADAATLVLKPIEFVQAEGQNRINKRKAEEEAQRNAAEAAVQAPAPTPAPTPAPSPTPEPAPTGLVPKPEAWPAPPATVVPIRPTSRPTLRLGEINERLAPLQITAEGLAKLGFPHALKERSSVLYHELDFPRICHAITQLATNAALKAIPSQAAA
jgi:predicted phage-related endonuclease